MDRKDANNVAPVRDDDDVKGGGPYILLSFLVTLGLIGGLLYFSDKPRSENLPQTLSSSDLPEPSIKYPIVIVPRSR